MPIRDNKLARQAQHRNRNKVVEDDQPTIEEQLVRLEEDIRRLKIEFDVYFNGAAKRPPYDTKSRVETLIKRLSDDRTISYAQRYHFNSLASRFTAFRELWRRTMQDREEGRDLFSAKAAAPVAVPSSQAAVFVCSDAHSDVKTIRNLYDAFVEAKRKCGDTEDLSFPRFHHLIATKADGLKERLGCERVRFSVDVDQGRVSFKVKGDKE